MRSAEHLVSFAQPTVTPSILACPLIGGTRRNQSRLAKSACGDADLDLDFRIGGEADQIFAKLLGLLFVTHSGLVDHSPVMLATLMIGSHFSNSPL